MPRPRTTESAHVPTPYLSRYSWYRFGRDIQIQNGMDVINGMAQNSRAWPAGRCWHHSADSRMLHCPGLLIFPLFLFTVNLPRDFGKHRYQFCGHLFFLFEMISHSIITSSQAILGRMKWVPVCIYENVWNLLFLFGDFAVRIFI